jgi:hypothetical protein
MQSETMPLDHARARSKLIKLSSERVLVHHHPEKKLSPFEFFLDIFCGNLLRSLLAINDFYFLRLSSLSVCASVPFSYFFPTFLLPLVIVWLGRCVVGVSWVCLGRESFVCLLRRKRQDPIRNLSSSFCLSLSLSLSSHPLNKHSSAD